MWKIKLEKIVANLFDIKASKIVHEWNGHIEIVGRPEVMETSKQYLLLRTDVLKSGWVSLCYRCASMVFLFIAYLIAPMHWVVGLWKKPLAVNDVLFE